jgi:hypothetical protein
MLRWKKIPGVPILIAYLCLFFFFLPVPSEGAMLESWPAGGEAAAARAAVTRLEKLGLSRQEAEARVAKYRAAGVEITGLALRAGGEPPADYDPPINNVVLVFLICGGAVAAGMIIGYNASK